MEGELMKQVMIITNPHPTNIQSLVESLTQEFSGANDAIVLSAQAVGLVLESAKGIPYNLTFEQTIKTTEKEIDAIIQERKVRYLVMVGTLERKELARFDAILGYREECDGQPVFSEWPIKHTLDVMTLDDADAVITEYSELSRFVVKLYQMLRGDK